MSKQLFDVLTTARNTKSPLCTSFRFTIWDYEDGTYGWREAMWAQGNHPIIGRYKTIEGCKFAALKTYRRVLGRTWIVDIDT